MCIRDRVVTHNGVIVDDVEVQIVNDKNMIPLRQVSNLLGISDDKIQWVEEKRIVLIEPRGITYQNMKEHIRCV